MLSTIAAAFNHAPVHSLACAMLFAGFIVACGCLIVGAIQIERARTAPARRLAARRRRFHAGR